ncbi:MAG: glycosyltransferase family 39 protein [Candidatus Aenigmatarchaeota archaeon]
MKYFKALSIEFKIFITFFVVYMLFVNWPGMRENSIFFLTKAIVDENRFEIDSYYNQTSDRAFYKNHYYSDKEPGLSFLAIPIYATWKFIYYNFFPSGFIKLHEGSGEYVSIAVHNKTIIYYKNPGFFELNSMFLVTVFTSSLLSSLTAVLLYRFCEFFSRDDKIRLVLVFIYGFGSLAFHSSLVFMGHITAAFLLFSPFFIIHVYLRRREPILCFLSGVLAGLAFIFDLLSFLVIFLIFFYLLCKKKYRESLVFSLGSLIGAFPFLFYNLIVFDNPFILPRNNLDKTIWPKLPGRDGVIIDLPYNLNVMIRQLFFPYRGLFYYFPILFFFLLGVYIMLKKWKGDAIFILMVFLLVTFVSSFWWAWWHGGSFGPRLLTIAIPFIVIPIVFVLKLDYMKLAILVFLLFSAFNNFAGLTNAYEDALKDISNSFMLKEYQERFKRFEVLEDPLNKFYYPYFFRCGSNSKVLDSIIEKGVIDIRASSDVNCPRPFLSLFIVLSFITLIWFRKIPKFHIRKIRFRISKMWYLYAVIIFLLFIFLNFLLVSFTVIFYPFDTDITESYVLTPAIRLFHGGPIYNDVHSPLYFSSFKYPPIFPLINYFTILIFGENLLSGRIIVFISTLLVGFFIFLITKKIVKSFKLSLFSTLLFFSSHVTFQMATQLRPDMLALLFSIVGIYFFLNYKKEMNFFLSVIFFLLSFFTKQTSIAATLSAFFYLLLNDKRNAMRFLILFSVLTVTFIFLINFLTEGQFILHVFYYARGIINFSLKRLLVWKGGLMNSIIFIFLGLFYFVKNRNNVISIWFFTSLILVIAGLMRLGGWINYFLEIIAIVPIIIASFLNQLKYKEEIYFLIISVIFQLMISVDFDNRVLLYIFNSTSFTPLVNLQTDLKIQNYVDSSDGNVLSEHAGYLILSGKQLSPEIWSSYELQKMGIVPRKEIFNYLLSQNYSTVIFSTRLPLLWEFFMYVKMNYVLVDELPWIDPAFFNTTFYVYKKI